jgi:hypothetical protein
LHLSPCWPRGWSPASGMVVRRKRATLEFQFKCGTHRCKSHDVKLTPPDLSTSSFTMMATVMMHDDPDDGKLQPQPIIRRSRTMITMKVAALVWILSSELTAACFAFQEPPRPAPCYSVHRGAPLARAPDHRRRAKKHVSFASPSLSDASAPWIDRDHGVRSEEPQQRHAVRGPPGRSATHRRGLLALASGTFLALPFSSAREASASGGATAGRYT